MTKFEDQLFDDLMSAHGPALDGVPDPAGRGRRGIGRPVGIAGAVLGVAGAVVLSSTLLTGAPAAYAVSKDANGMVTVSISELTGVTGANEELRRLGVRAVAVPMRDGCVDLGSLPAGTSGASGRSESRVDEATGGGGGSVTFDAGSIPEGDTLLLAAATPAGGVSLGMALIKGDVPDCVSAPTPPVHGPGQADQQTEVRPGAPASGSGGK